MLGSLPPVIGVIGAMESGKGTVASMLVEEYGYGEGSFAYPLRQCVQDMILARKPHPELPEHMAEHIMECHPNEPWIKPTTAAMREILQYVGTDIFRRKDPDHWVKAWMRTVNQNCRTVMSDVRFPNEASAIEVVGGVNIRVTRKSARQYGIVGHESEQHINEIPVLLVIDNNGTLEELRAAVRAAMSMIRASRQKGTGDVFRQADRPDNPVHSDSSVLCHHSAV